MFKHSGRLVHHFGRRVTVLRLCPGMTILSRFQGFILSEKFQGPAEISREKIKDFNNLAGNHKGVCVEIPII